MKRNLAAIRKRCDTAAHGYEQLDNALADCRHLLDRLEAAEDVVSAVQHAIEIGYFSEEGSTSRMIKDALAAYDQATGEIDA